MITLKKSDYEKILSHARTNLPEEACGLIAGTIEENGEIRHIEQVYLLENTDHSNEHFNISPKDQLDAIKNMRSKNLKPLGNWHSHPESPSRPSEEDKRLFFDSTARYLILSLQDNENPVLNAFIVKNHTEVSKDELVII
ncbi:MAG: M67 family metallopeptidase [Treponemataceae bacterium]|nr:M67 family metallopeptidase [Treponemataceae bacterium]